MDMDDDDGEFGINALGIHATNEMSTVLSLDAGFDEAVAREAVAVPQKKVSVVGRILARVGRFIHLSSKQGDLS